ncbi:MAG: ATP-binding cassette domain-containing protein [Burkholderiales bacterium]|nr:ATP-binding cassette domain-containing protein [Burkholderiales bacterium]
MIATGDWQTFRRLLEIARPYRARLLAGLLMLALVSLTEPVLMIAFSRILDRGFSHATSGAGGASLVAPSALTQSIFAPLTNLLDQVPVLWFPLFLVGVFAVRGAANFLGDIALHWVSSRVVFDLRQRTFAHMLRLPVGWFDRNSTAELTSKLTFDTQQIGAVTSQALTTLAQDTVKLVAQLALMAAVSWRLTLGVFVIAPVVALVVRFLTRRLRAASVALQAQMGELSRFADEALGSQRVVKIYAAFAQMATAFTARANAVRRTIMKQETANAASAPLLHLTVSFAIAGIVALAIREGQRNAMSAGDFMAFFGALLGLLPPIKSLSSVNAVLQRGFAAAGSVFAVLDSKPESGITEAPMSGAVAGAVRQPAPAIEFRNVSLRYPDRDRDALSDVSLVVPGGARVAFVGGSGSGKSSALALLAGFYSPDVGSVLLDGVAVTALGPAATRSQIALVDQHVLLISDSVKANIAFGVAEEAIDESRVRWAAAAAGADVFVESLPQGYGTAVGEGGGLLSGGQRQRIAIARALYKGAPIIVFDEATSALDSESESVVQESVRQLGGGHTVVQVAHRLSSIRDADVIFVFDAGRIVEFGNHAQLSSRNGAYARLLAAQSG